MYCSGMANPEESEPGQRAHLSGIYIITHDRDHAQPHDVTSIAGEHFPPCSKDGQTE